MRLPLVALLAFAALLALSPPASADVASRWRRTSPRVVAEDAADGTILLRVPAGRAWGLESRPFAVVPGGRYLARVRFEVPPDSARVAFVRVAAYARPDGRGRQMAIFDSAPVRSGGSGVVEVELAAPAGAHALKLRLLARRSAAGERRLPIRVGDPGLGPSPRSPPVVLRAVE